MSKAVKPKIQTTSILNFDNKQDYRTNYVKTLIYFSHLIYFYIVS